MIDFWSVTMECTDKTKLVSQKEILNFISIAEAST